VQIPLLLSRFPGILLPILCRSICLDYHGGANHPKTSADLSTVAILLVLVSPLCQMPSTFREIGLSIVVTDEGADKIAWDMAFKLPSN